MMYKESKVGDYVKLTHYCLVEDTDSDGEWTSLRDVKTGFGFFCKGATQDQLVSCSEWHDEEKVCRTTLAEKLIRSNGLVFTVTFIKENGEKRKLIGHYVSQETLMGRSRVWDLEKHEMRLVDHRTIEELIVDDIKYKLK